MFQLAARRRILAMALISTALAGGAEQWTAPLAPRRPALPAKTQNPIDAFLKDVPGTPVSDALYARRLYLDLWGLPPWPEQLAEFQRDRDPAKRAKLAERLLAHKRNYTGHWISLYNDLLRNDDGVIYHGERKSITNWLEKALEDNLPYDKFVTALLDPDTKTGPDGFIIGVNWRGEVPASERPPLQAAQNSAQTFLGVNLKCNVCHDSFISRWKLADAYGLASYFSAEPLEVARCDVKTGEFAKPRFLFPDLPTSLSGGNLKQRRAEVARLFTAPENGRLARTLVNRYWKQLFGRGIVEPVDDMAAEPWNADLLDWLASDFADNGYDLKRLLRTMVTSRAYQLPVQPPGKAGERYVFRGPHARRLSAEQFADSIASITGEWRFKTPAQALPARYVRDWELKSTTLTRALGRPVRDQVTTGRLTQPTTLQALELVNGTTLATWLSAAGKRLEGSRPPAPANLFDSGVVRRNQVNVDVPLRGAKKLWLIVENIDSYDPARVIPQWKDAVLLKGTERVPLATLTGGTDPEKLALPSQLSIAADGFDRFQAVAQVAKESAASDVGPAIRFFLFDQEPDLQRLVRVEGDSPSPPPPPRMSTTALIGRVYQHALSREPSPRERGAAEEVFGGKLTADAAEDFLWMIFLSPEFQYIR
jgi:hypothetical protein